MSQKPGDVVVVVRGSALGAHPGAEVAGIVSEAGEAAAEWLGRPVLVPRLLPCGECSLCQRGRVAQCAQRQRRGAPVPTETVPARFLLPLGPPLLPEAVPDAEIWRYAALCDALGAPYGGLVRALGCQAVVILPDAGERARLCAPPFSAIAALDSQLLDPEAGRAAVRELAAQAGLLTHGLCLIETTGTDAGRARALGMVEAGGTALLLDRMQPQGPMGGEGLAAPLPAGPGLWAPALLENLCQEQGQVIGAGAAHPDLLPELLALVQRSELDLSALTVAVAPSDIDPVLCARRRGEGDRLMLPVVRFS